MRRWRRVLIPVFVAACTTSGGADTTEAPSTSAPTTTTLATTSTTAQRPSIAETLEELGGEQCPDSDFTCVTIEMPLDHNDPSNDDTVGVTFAVLPATGQSRGAFVTATGGPGSSGIAVADSYTSALDPAIPDSYDIVFFDQRGLAMSGGLTCPAAAASYYRVDALTGLGIDEEALSAASAQFVEDCIAEIGDGSDLLPFLGTDQVAADLEAFRSTFDFDELVLYGESYGTQVAQTYAASYGDRLTRMILDGTVDLTLDGFTFFHEQASAFGATLQSTLDYCRDDDACDDDMLADPDQAYDRLLSLLVEEPLVARYPLPGGGFEERQFGLGDLEVVASGQMYSEDDRMMFLRALAAYSGRGDLVPLLRLLYVDLGVDPVDETVIDDPTWSDAIYYAVECLDYSYPGTTPEERAAAFFSAAGDLDLSRLGSLFFGDLPCAYWPSAVLDQPRPEPLAAPGVPTLVLGATADPATPYLQGVAVSERLEQGNLITKDGGPHVIFGRGNPCPDDATTAFILGGTAPEETACDGDVVGYYIPLLPETVEVFEDAEAMLDAVEYEIFYLPEYYWWDTVTDVSFGCNLGGTMTVTAGDEGDVFTFEDCVFMDGLSLTGDGGYNWDEDIFTLEVQNASAECSYSYRREGESYRVEDNCATDGFS